jgi:uncharacterized protein (UPF0276 family)
VGVNLLPDAGFRAAALPLFAAGAIDALEWDIDDAWGFDSTAEHPPPAWVDDILDAYAEDDALYGHGVWFSVLTAERDDRQRRWLDRLATECARRRYRHVTEHFGWSTAAGFLRNTMLPCPYTAEAVEVGRDSLALLSAAAGAPVGLETLAAALGPSDAELQGAFLAELGGFVLLDLHNVWTQATNLGLDARALVDRYPLPLVREIHVSGGDWWRGVRTDSHDGEVPRPVMALFDHVLPRCPALEVVFLERRGDTLDDPAEQARWRADFLALRARCE